MGHAREYQKHLYSNDLDGYLQLARLEGKERHFRADYLTAANFNLDDQQGRTDYFITPNSFYLPQRLSINIRHYRALYTDLDSHTLGYGKAETVYSTILLAEEGKIPHPTLIVDSGRGIHVYWRIEHAPKGAMLTWQMLQDHFYKQLKHLGADTRATDSARLLRLPGTINSKNGELCKVLYQTNKKYSMYDLRDQFLDWAKPKTKTKSKSKSTVRHIFNPYTLHMARLNDLLTLCKLRNYDVRGHRNSILHLYAYWQGVTRRDQDELSDSVKDLNNKFKEPLTETEVNAVLRCIPKVVDSFLNPPPTPPAKGERWGYNYRNTTLIEMLDIDKHEQKHLKTIISQEEKYRRNNSRRREARRNEDGLTNREQQAMDMKTTIKHLRDQGLTLKEIAEHVGLTLNGVKYHLYR